MGAYKQDAVVVIQLGAYIHRVLTFYGCLLSRFYGMSIMLSATGATARVQDGNLTNYMDASFVLLVHVGSETWTSQSLHFTHIHLHSCCRSSCVGDMAPKCSTGCGFVSLSHLCTRPHLLTYVYLVCM